MLAAAVLAACAPVQLRTARAPTETCELALTSGSLERHPQTGLGIANGDGVLAVEWPFGYTARTDVNLLQLVDERGQVVAREHDRVNVGGSMADDAGPNPVWRACGPVTVESNVGG